MTSIKLAEGDTPVPKHVGVDTYHDLCFTLLSVFFWLIYCNQRFEVVLSILGHHTLDPLPVVELMICLLFAG